MAAKAVHMPVTIGRAAAAEEHRHLVQALGRFAPEVEHHRRRFEVGLRVAFLGMHEVGKLDRIFDEEHRRGSCRGCG